MVNLDTSYQNIFIFYVFILKTLYEIDKIMY